MRRRCRWRRCGRCSRGRWPGRRRARGAAALDTYRNAIGERRDRGNVVDLDPAEDADGARDADALVALCIAASGGSGEDRPPLPVQMLVHVDLDVLTGENSAGRGHLEEGPVLSLVPGCAKPAIICHPHHLWHCRDGGPSVPWNLLSLCSFHHFSLHRREWLLIRTAAGDLIFTTCDGRVIGTATGGWWRLPREMNRNEAGP